MFFPFFKGIPLSSLNVKVQYFDVTFLSGCILFSTEDETRYREATAEAIDVKGIELPEPPSTTTVFPVKFLRTSVRPLTSMRQWSWVTWSAMGVSWTSHGFQQKRTRPFCTIRQRFGAIRCLFSAKPSTFWRLFVGLVKRAHLKMIPRVQFLKFHFIDQAD